MTLRLVLFDLVGTLLDERADHEALDLAMAAAAQRFGLEVDPASLSGEFALALMEILHAEPEADEPADFMPFHEAAPDLFAGVMQFHDVSVTAADKRWFWTHYLDVQRATWRSYREVPDTLQQLSREGLRLGVVTDADRYMLDDILPALSWSELIEVRVSAEEVGHPKPHPALVEEALRRADVRASEAVMVGDSYEQDLVAAQRAGVRQLVLVDRHKARTLAIPTIADLSGLDDVLSMWRP